MNNATDLRAASFAGRIIVKGVHETMPGEMASPTPFVERRSGTDRRQRPTSPLSVSSLFGSRRQGRRKTDRLAHHYVDRYGMRAVGAVLASLLLCMIDGFMTLYLLSQGAQELNPVMDYFLRIGPLAFLLVKYLITGVCLTWLLVHKDYPMMRGLIRGKSLLVAVPVLYGLLVLYELYLAFVYIPSF
jgi:hypothetical protein